MGETIGDKDSAQVVNFSIHKIDPFKEANPHNKAISLPKLELVLWLAWS
jgi:hypothetical protein